MAFDLLPHAFFNPKNGGMLRYAQFEPTVTPRGTVLIIPGRREFIEKKWAEVGSALVALGLRVVIIEPRGQGLSTRLLSGDQRQRDHGDDFDQHLDDLRAFYAAILMPDLRGPLFLHGHSLGGHLVLRWLAEDHLAVAGAFLTSPMMALSGMPAHLAAHGVSWFNARLFGQSHAYAPLQHDFGAEDCVFDGNVLTQDADRFRIIEDYFTAHPDLTVGGVTWGWLLAALKSMQSSHTLHYLGRIAVPVLALIGSEDKVTPAKDIAPYINLVPRVRTHIVDGSRHDILNESEPIRAEALSKVTEFLTSLIES